MWLPIRAHGLNARCASSSNGPSPNAGARAESHHPDQGRTRGAGHRHDARGVGRRGALLGQRTSAAKAAAARANGAKGGRPRLPVRLARVTNDAGSLKQRSSANPQALKSEALGQRLLPAEQHVRRRRGLERVEAARARARLESSRWRSSDADQLKRDGRQRCPKGVNSRCVLLQPRQRGRAQATRLNKNGLAIVPPGSIEQLESR